MNRKLFSDEEILNLSNNKYVKAVSEKEITYTDEFKTLFIAEHSNAKCLLRFLRMLDSM